MRDFIPAIYPGDGPVVGGLDENEGLINCIPVMLRNNEIAAQTRGELKKDSSFTASSADDRGRGITAFAGQVELYLDQDTYYYSGGSQDLTVTSAPGYAGNTGFNEEYSATFVDHNISGTPNLVIVNAGHTSTNVSANHGNVWYAADAVSAPASISDSNMPGNNGVSLIRGGASLDGFFFVGDIFGNIHNSNLNDITTWTSTDSIKAERRSDNGVYLGRHHDNIVYIGTHSIEFFYNAGNASGSPLARRQDISYSVGCVFPNSVYEEGDIIYFVGNSADGVIGVYRIVNFSLEKISDLNIDDRFRKYSAGLDTSYTLFGIDALNHKMWLTGGAMNGNPGIYLTFDYFFTYFYSRDFRIWSKFSYGDTVTYPGGTASNWTDTLPISGFDGILSSTGVYRMQMINGTIVELGSPDNDAMNDLAANNSPDVYLTFPRWDGGTNKKKRINSVNVVTEAYAFNSGVVDPLLVQLKWRDFDRKSESGDTDHYNTGREIDLNTRSPKVSRLGSSRSRRFRIDHTTGHGGLSPIKGLEIEYEIVE